MLSPLLKSLCGFSLPQRGNASCLLQSESPGPGLPNLPLTSLLSSSQESFPTMLQPCVLPLATGPLHVLFLLPSSAGPSSFTLMPVIQVTFVSGLSPCYTTSSLGTGLLLPCSQVFKLGTCSMEMWEEVNHSSECACARRASPSSGGLARGTKTTGARLWEPTALMPSTPPLQPRPISAHGPADPDYLLRTGLQTRA